MAGCRRLVWNHFLNRRREQYLATGKALSFAEMYKELTVMKHHPAVSFLNDCDSQALQQVLKDLCRAYVNFFEGRARYPKRKRKHKTPHSFRITQRVSVDGDCVYIPKAGKVPILLHRAMEGQIKSATIKQEPNGKWTITFVSHFEAPETERDTPENPVGLDAGLETFVTTSEGDKTPPPKFYRKQERKLCKAQRAFSRTKKGSRNRVKAKHRVSKVHVKTRNKRNDWLHKHSRTLADKHDAICVEDLAISALVKTKLRGHSKSWTDASWGTFRSQLSYKLDWQGKRLQAVSRWYPSSQECHVCHERSKNDLSVREWTCPHCNTKHDRDINAALNSLSEGLRLLACGNQDNPNVCRETVRLLKEKHVSLKQKPSNCEVGSTALQGW